MGKSKDIGGEKIILVDRNGNAWTEANLLELIEALSHYREFKDILNHYRGRI